MANNPIAKVNIDSDRIRTSMEQENMSFRQLSERIGKEGLSDRQIRKYISDGQCPPQLVSDLCRVLHLVPSRVLIGPTVWMRLGVTVQVTDEEFEYILGQSDCGDIEISDAMAAEFLKRAVPDDDCYIPENCVPNK